MADIVVDFKGVQKGGARSDRVPEGDYKVTVKEVKVGESKSSGNTMLIWSFQISEGKQKGKKLVEYTVLNKDSYWKLLSLLEAFGLEVGEKKINITKLIKKLVGKSVGVTVVDEPYEDKNGNEKMSSKIAEYIDLETLSDFADAESSDDDEEEDSDEDDEEEKPKKSKKGKKGKKAKKDEDEIEDLDLDEDI